MLIFKSLHIIFVIAWFAALFYFVRLLVYHVEAQAKPEAEKKILSAQFMIMEQRLRSCIMIPASILTLIFGLALLPSFMPLSAHPWLIAKLVLVVLLFGYQGLCGKIYKSFKAGKFGWSSGRLRLLNEGATLFLIAIVFLVVTKDVLSMIWAVCGFGLIGAVAMLLLKSARKKKEES